MFSMSDFKLAMLLVGGYVLLVAATELLTTLVP